MFLFSWIPARPSAWSSFYGVDLAFCILAGALEASQIFSTERQNEHTEAPSRSKPWSAWHTRLFTSTSEGLWYLMSHLHKTNANVTGCCVRLRSQCKFYQEAHLPWTKWVCPEYVMLCDINQPTCLLVTYLFFQVSRNECCDRHKLECEGCACRHNITFSSGTTIANQNVKTTWWGCVDVLQQSAPLLWQSGTFLLEGVCVGVGGAVWMSRCGRSRANGFSAEGFDTLEQ